MKETKRTNQEKRVVHYLAALWKGMLQTRLLEVNASVVWQKFCNSFVKSLLQNTEREHEEKHAVKQQDQQHMRQTKTGTRQYRLTYLGSCVRLWVEVPADTPTATKPIVVVIIRTIKIQSQTNESLQPLWRCFILVIKGFIAVAVVFFVYFCLLFVVWGVKREAWEQHRNCRYLLLSITKTNKQNSISYLLACVESDFWWNDGSL